LFTGRKMFYPCEAGPERQASLSRYITHMKASKNR
jgi:hypothetical protein